MSVRPGILSLALLTFAIVVSPAAAGGGSQPFIVTSTLDGKRVLPLRMHWLAYPKLPASQVSRVEFQIDGKVRWIERHAPYNYASDDNGRNLGYLITTWLAPGRHRFAVRATDKRGRQATDNVVAGVLPAPELPAALKGMWTRVVTNADLEKSDPRFGSGPRGCPGRRGF